MWQYFWPGGIRFGLPRGDRKVRSFDQAPPPAKRMMSGVCLRWGPHVGGMCKLGGRCYSRWWAVKN